METESPQGLNLHPAKQPRTTLFDWLPAGLPSVPAWRDLHGSLCFSFPSLRLIFFFFCFFRLILSLVILFLRNCPFALSLLFSSSVTLLTTRQICRRSHIGNDREKRTFTDHAKAASFLECSFYCHSEDCEENIAVPFVSIKFYMRFFCRMCSRC